MDVVPFSRHLHSAGVALPRHHGRRQVWQTGTALHVTLYSRFVINWRLTKVCSLIKKKANHSNQSRFLVKVQSKYKGWFSFLGCPCCMDTEEQASRLTQGPLTTSFTDWLARSRLSHSVNERKWELVKYIKYMIKLKHDCSARRQCVILSYKCLFLQWHCIRYWAPAALSVMPRKFM